MAAATCDNRYPYNVEIKSETRDVPEQPDVVNVHVSLNFNTHLYAEDQRGDTPYYTLAILGATMALNADGFEVLEESKHGKLIIGNYDYTAEVETELTNTKHAKGSVKLSPTEMSAGGDLGGDTAERTKTQHTERHRHLTVQAAGANTWKIRNPNRVPLDGYVMNGEALCQCKTRWDGNHREIVLEIRVLARDIAVNWEEGSTWLSRLIGDDDGKRIANVVMSKRLHELNSDQPFAGEVIMSRAIHPDDA